jgi:predicted Holliday junction resolvase-like endonuclease
MLSFHLIKRICNESAEIKELRNRINMAKLNQERSMQIYERQNRQLSQLNADAETDEQMLKRLEEEKKTEIQKEAKRKSELLNSKYVIYNKIVGSSKTNARSRNTKG